MEDARSPGGPVHWEDVRPRSILKTDEKKAEKRDAANRYLLDRQRNEITLKILVLGAAQSGKSSFIRSAVDATGFPTASRGPAGPAEPAPATYGIETTTLLAVMLDATPVFWRLVEVSDAYLRSAPPGHLRALFAGVYAAFVLFDAGEGGAAMASLAGADRCRDELQRRCVARLPPGLVAANGGAAFPMFLVAYCADGVVGAGVRAVAGSGAGAQQPQPALSSRRRLVAADTYAASEGIRGGRGGGAQRWAKLRGGSDASAEAGALDAAGKAAGGGRPAAPLGSQAPTAAAGGKAQAPPAASSSRRSAAPPATAPVGGGVGATAATAGPRLLAGAAAASVASALQLPAPPAPLDVPEYCYGLSGPELAAFAASAGYRAAVLLCTPWLAEGYTGVLPVGGAVEAQAHKVKQKQRQQLQAPSSADAAHDSLRSGPPAPAGSDRHRATSLAAAQRFRTVVADVSEAALGYWGYLGGGASEEPLASAASASSHESRDDADLPGLPRVGSEISLASSSAGGDTGSVGSAGVSEQQQQARQGPDSERRSWYAWRRPWPAAVDPPGAP